MPVPKRYTLDPYDVDAAFNNILTLAEAYQVIEHHHGGAAARDKLQHSVANHVMQEKHRGATLALMALEIIIRHNATPEDQAGLWSAFQALKDYVDDMPVGRFERRHEGSSS